MDDLIKRSDAIKAFNECLEKSECGTMLDDDRYYKRLQDIPSADRPQGDDWEKYSDKLWKNAYERGKADRPQGKWICHKGGWIDFDYYPTKYECDQCHHYVDVASDKNYCPNCGTRMKGADDEVCNNC